MSSARTTPNWEMCVRGEAAWVREAWLLNARAESTKNPYCAQLAWGVLFLVTVTHFVSFLAIQFCLPLPPFGLGPPGGPGGLILLISLDVL